MRLRLARRPSRRGCPFHAARRSPAGPLARRVCLLNYSILFRSLRTLIRISGGSRRRARRYRVSGGFLFRSLPRDSSSFSFSRGGETGNFNIYKYWQDLRIILIKDNLLGHRRAINLRKLFRLRWLVFFFSLTVKPILASEPSRNPAVFRSRLDYTRSFRLESAEVCIRYFPSDRTFARRAERTKEKQAATAAATVGKPTSLASLSAAREMAKPLNSLRQREQRARRDTGFVSRSSLNCLESPPPASRPSSSTDRG